MATEAETKTIGRLAVLGWAATSAVGLGLPDSVKIGLLTQFQNDFNASRALLLTVLGSGGAAPTLLLDGLWGANVARAMCIALVCVRAVGEDMAFLQSVGIADAFDLAHVGAAISTEARVRTRFASLRDAISIFSNQTHGIAQGLRDNATALLDVARTGPTLVEVRQKAREYLATLFVTSTTPESAPTAQVVSTRTAPSTTYIKQATQTPSTTPNILPSAAPVAPVAYDFADGEDVGGRDFAPRVPLAVVIPSVIVGALLLVWGVKTYQERRR